MSAKEKTAQDQPEPLPASSQGENAERVSVPEIEDAQGMFEMLSGSIPKMVEPVEGFDLSGFEPVQNVTGGASQGENTDKAGTAFDPEIHRSDADGNPIRKKNGDFAKKPGKGGSKVGRSEKQKAQEEQARPLSEDEIAHAKIKGNAVLMVAATYGAGMAIFGEHGAKDYSEAPPTEAKELQEAWEAAGLAEYARTGKVPEPPPWALPAIATAKYMAVRLSTSKPARSRVSQIWKGAQEKMFSPIVRRVIVPIINKWKGRKKPKHEKMVKRASDG